MNLEQELIYLDKNYKILAMEQEFIVHPAAFGLIPLTKASLQGSFSGTLHIENYHLFLDALTIHNAEPVFGLKTDTGNTTYEFENCLVPYNGAILIGANPGKEYYIKENKPSFFTYQNVIELVFEDGNLITTIDQCKAMLRIRKNLELGLRSLSVNRDVRCIKRFMNSAFVGDYNSIKLPNSRMKHLQDMKKEYMNKKLLIR